MFNYLKTAGATWLVIIVTASPSTAGATEPAAETAAAMSSIVVYGNRSEQSSFDLPLSISRVGRSDIQDHQLQINLSEALARVPGVVAQNRQNYAQDLQISIRGFGARSAFGVRGIRVYVDDIPATMPDGQGQLSHIDLGSAEHIEVLRGPFSALYGNSSGGVIAVFTEQGKTQQGNTEQGKTEQGKTGAAINASLAAGSFNTVRQAIKISGGNDTFNYLGEAAQFRTDGYREHSAAERNNFNSKLIYNADASSQFKLIVNAVDIPEAEDALGLTRSQWQKAPRQAGSNAEAFDTRKSVRQLQIGAVYDRQWGAADSTKMLIYRGSRQTVQYQALPISSQVSLANSGGVIDLDRRFVGTDMHWTHLTELLETPLQFTVGFNYDALDESRLGFENFVATSTSSQTGIKGALRRDETNTVYDFDQYLQAQWEPSAQWLLAAGIRHNHIAVHSDDHFVVAGNGDDSGSVDYRATTPVLGITYRVTPTTRIYASYGEGFETPTLNELAYRSTSGTLTGLNLNLQPSRSDNYEIGVKSQIADNTTLELASFLVQTQNELAVQANANGRSVYQNVGQARRTGFELNLRSQWQSGVAVEMSYTLLQALYTDAFQACPGVPCTLQTITSGNRIPGVPQRAWYGELSWQHAASGFSAGMEIRGESKVYVNDANSDATAPYFATNLHAGFKQEFGDWYLKELVRVDNLFDREYIGSVIVNESNARYFEPAAGRTFYAALNVERKFN